MQFLGKFAGTVPLSKEQWLITVSIGFVSLFIAVVVKLIPVPKNQTVCGSSSHGESESPQANGYQVIPSEPEI